MPPAPRIILLPALVALLGGCIAPRERLTFPEAALTSSPEARRYDTDANDRADFSLLLTDGRCVAVAYDDDEDGRDDRVYRLDALDDQVLPHVVLMLDSVPYHAAAQRWERGDWPWFAPPAKVIPPFPTMSGVIFTSLLRAPPLPGVINRYYDRDAAGVNNMIVRRSFGARHPWHRRLHYTAAYWENGLAFLQPRVWYPAEMARAFQAVDRSPDRVTLLYIASSSGMLSRYGRAGAEEVLDQVAPFCLQLLHARQGAVRISVLADHGHNYLEGRRVNVAAMLQEAGFRPVGRLRHELDVVVEQDGLVSYVGLHTRSAGPVAEAMAARAEVQLVAHLEQDQVMVRNAHGAAAIDERDGRLRYRTIDHDVLGYESVVRQLADAGLADADGFASPDDWLTVTADHPYPDAPVRLWRAFHGLVVNTPDVMVCLADGYCGGIAMFEWFIRMKSTHGGIDQINSATFLLDMTGRAPPVLRSDQVLHAILPGYEPRTQR